MSFRVPTCNVRFIKLFIFEKVTELIIQLREYESGTYGLEDAMIRIKDLQKQKQVRDAQIEQLVQNSNQLQDEVSFLEQENQILR